MVTFIIGTDTGVGKTYYGKQLIKKGKRVLKPIETGKKTFNSLSESDCYSYSIMQQIPIEETNIYFFNEPVSPHFAAEMDGVTIDIEKLKAFIIKNSGAYVELAGGLMVPITYEYSQLDLIKEFTNAKVDVVVGNKLGCINHSLLTLKMLYYEGITIGEVFINGMGLEYDAMMTNNERVINNYVENIKQSF